MIEVGNRTPLHGPSASIEDVLFRVEPGRIVGFLWKLGEPQAAGVEGGEALDPLAGMSRGHTQGIAIEQLGNLARYHLTKPQLTVVVKKTGNTHLPAIQFGQAHMRRTQLRARKEKMKTVKQSTEPTGADPSPS